MTVVIRLLLFALLGAIVHLLLALRLGAGGFSRPRFPASPAPRLPNFSLPTRVFPRCLRCQRHKLQPLKTAGYAGYDVAFV